MVIFHLIKKDFKNSNNYSRRLFSVLTTATFMVMSGLSLAKDLVLGVEDIEYYPLYAQRAGEYSGFAREFFDAFAKKYGHTIIYKPLPIKRLYSDFFNGRVDLKFPDSPYWMQDKRKGLELHYTSSIIEYIDGVMVVKGNLNKGKAALRTLGSVRGFTPWTYSSDVNQGKIVLKENADIDGLIRLIESGRVDGGYFNIKVAEYYLKHTLFEPNLVIFDKSLPFSKGSYFVSTLHHPDVIEELDQFIIEEAEFIKGLKRKYEISL